MTQRDMAGYLDIDPKTLRNWRKHKPKLYEKVLQGFALEAAVKDAKKNYLNLEQHLVVNKSNK